MGLNAATLEPGVNLLRFGRQIFMFITGLVLFYNYSGRKVNLHRFFSRRLKNLAIPYVIWTAYLPVQPGNHHRLMATSPPFARLRGQVRRRLQ
ncbi:hypothetical protein MGLY_15080 [Neomoorella glycerini]|nr:acyltransferase family protein [Moorella glycerini]QGP92150.1 hypothetical protein MGLY_15080 [Moorella glycerini]